jgi:hypothetical protein
VSPNANRDSAISPINTYNTDPDADLYNIDNIVGPKPVMKTKRAGLEEILRTPDEFTSVFGRIAKNYEYYQSSAYRNLRKDRATKEEPGDHASKLAAHVANSVSGESHISGASGPEDRTSSRHDMHFGGHRGHKDSYSSTKGKSDPLLDDVMKHPSKGS